MRGPCGAAPSLPTVEVCFPAELTVRYDSGLDIDSGKLLRAYDSLAETILAIAFTPDGRRALARGRKGSSTSSRDGPRDLVERR